MYSVVIDDWKQEAGSGEPGAGSGERGCNNDPLFRGGIEGGERNGEQAAGNGGQDTARIIRSTYLLTLLIVILVPVTLSPRNTKGKTY